jgi:hypothetical protein
MKISIYILIQLIFISSLFSKVEAVYINNKVQISWNNPKHIEVDYFVLERSKNGIRFKEIQKIDAVNNNGNTIEYNEVDYIRLKTKAYYRVKQIDVDGFFYYSDIAVVNNFSNVKPLFNLFSKSNTNRGLKNYEGTNILVILLDVKQKKFVSRVDLLFEKNRLITTYVSDFLPTGEYIVIGSSDDKIYGKKIHVNGSHTRHVYTQSKK